MYDFIILKEDKLDKILFKEKKATISDFAIVLGGFVSNNVYTSNSDKNLKTRTGLYWTSTPITSEEVRVVNVNGNKFDYNVDLRNVGARPALYYQSLGDIPYTNKRKLSNNEMEIEFGFYPQTAPDKTTQNRLLIALNEGSLSETGNTYTIDSRKYDKYDKKFKRQTLKEYEFEGKRYVCLTVNSYFYGSIFQLSNGEYYKDGDQVFIEVEPVKWKAFKKERICLAEKILFAGVQFDLENNYKGEFHKTNMKWFMDKYFSKDLLQNHNLIAAKKLESQVGDSSSNYPKNFKKRILSPFKTWHSKK